MIEINQEIIFGIMQHTLLPYGNLFKQDNELNNLCFEWFELSETNDERMAAIETRIKEIMVHLNTKGITEAVLPRQRKYFGRRTQ